MNISLTITAGNTIQTVLESTVERNYNSNIDLKFTDTSKCHGALDSKFLLQRDLQPSKFQKCNCQKCKSYINGQKVIHETLLMCALFWQALVTSGAPFGPRSSCETITTASSVVSSYVGSVSKSQLHIMFMDHAVSRASALPLTLFKEDPE